MLQNGMVVGAAAEWDAICESGIDTDQLADEAIAEAVKELATARGLVAAINEAQAGGSINGEVLAAVLMPIDFAARWKALTRMAEDLIVAGAINIIYREPGVPFDRYSDLDTKAIEANITPRIRDGVAEKLAEMFGQCRFLVAPAVLS